MAEVNVDKSTAAFGREKAGRFRPHLCSQQDGRLRGISSGRLTDNKLRSSFVQQEGRKGRKKMDFRIFREDETLRERRESGDFFFNFSGRLIKKFITGNEGMKMVILFSEDFCSSGDVWHCAFDESTIQLSTVIQAFRVEL